MKYSYCKIYHGLVLAIFASLLTLSVCASAEPLDRKGGEPELGEDGSYIEALDAKQRAAQAQADVAILQGVETQNRAQMLALQPYALPAPPALPALPAPSTQPAVFSQTPYDDCVAMSDEEFKDFGPKYMAGSNKDLYEHLDANAAYSLFSVDQVIALIKRRCATNDCYAIAARKLFPYVVDRKNWPKVYNMIPQNDLPALQNYCKQEMQRKPSPCHRD